MATFKFYTDAALTTPVVSNVQFGEGTTTTTIYVGSTDATKKLQSATSPGVNPVEVTIVDSTPGSGPEDDWVTLALTLPELSTNNPGDPLELGTTVYGGVANAVPVYVKVVNSLSGATSSTQLSLQLDDVKEFAV
jgi:hypothetical protein